MDSVTALKVCDSFFAAKLSLPSSFSLATFSAVIFSTYAVSHLYARMRSEKQKGSFILAVIIKSFSGAKLNLGSVRVFISISLRK